MTATLSDPLTEVETQRIMSRPLYCRCSLDHVHLIRGNWYGVRDVVTSLERGSSLEVGDVHGEGFTVTLLAAHVVEVWSR